jgi:Fur family ferric uptake transcriptional regulator
MSNIRKTKHRAVLLEIFEQAEGAVLLSDLIQELQQKMNRTTVYRILQKLEAHGILHSFAGNDGLKWYARCEGYAKKQHAGTHPHFQCKACGKVECLPIDIPIPIVPDYKIDAAKLLLVGQCSDCVS